MGREIASGDAKAGEELLKSPSDILGAPPSWKVLLLRDAHVVGFYEVTSGYLEQESVTPSEGHQIPASRLANLLHKL